MVVLAVILSLAVAVLGLWAFERYVRGHRLSMVDGFAVLGEILFHLFTGF